MENVLAIMGSHRKNMNTDILLDEVIKGIDKSQFKVKKIYLSDLNISICKSCYVCSKTGQCYINDDMQDLYKEFFESKYIIVASPVYFNTVSSLLKIMIDRCQVLWSKKYKINKLNSNDKLEIKGIFLCTAGSKYYDKQFDGSDLVMSAFFKSINAEYKYKLFCSNTDEMPIKQRKDILDKAYYIGKTL